MTQKIAECTVLICCLSTNPTFVPNRKRSQKKISLKQKARGVVKEFTKKTHNLTERVHFFPFRIRGRHLFLLSASLDFVFLSAFLFFLLCSSSVRYIAASSQRWLVSSFNSTHTDSRGAGCLTHVKEPHARLKTSINVPCTLLSLPVHVITPLDKSVYCSYP